MAESEATIHQGEAWAEVARKKMAESGANLHQGEAWTELARKKMAESGATVYQGGASSEAQTTNLTGAKEARKRAEQDARLLANRIALLKLEEEKAWKNIDETKKRSDEITRNWQQYENKVAAKESRYEAKWEAIRLAQQRNAMAGETRRAVRDRRQEGLVAEKQARAQVKKAESQQYMLQRQELEAAELEAKAARSRYIRAQKEEAKLKAEEAKLAQLEKTREEHESRAAVENLLRERTDALIADMERQEEELIQRLQNTQAIQQNLYQELESAMGQASGPHISGHLRPKSAARLPLGVQTGSGPDRAEPGVLKPLPAA